MPRRKKVLRFTWKGKVWFVRKAIGTGKMKPKPFLKKAADSEWPHIVRNMEGALK